MNTDDVVVTGLGLCRVLAKTCLLLRRPVFGSIGNWTAVAVFVSRRTQPASCGAGAGPGSVAHLLPGCTSRPDRFGIAAALAAVEHAGLSTPDLRDAAVLFGTGTGGAIETEQYLRELQDGMLPSPKLLVTHQPASVTDLVARILLHMARARR